MPADDVLTYYGYEQPHTQDWDYKSWMGLGDRQNDLTAGYSAALSISARKSILGVDSQTSTGQEFTYKGKTYRDDDTSPQSFANIDVYSPGGVPGSSTYNPAIVTPLGKASGQSLASAGSLTTPLSDSSGTQAALSELQQPTDTSTSTPQSSSAQENQSLLSNFKKAFPQHANVDLSKIMEKVAQIHPNIEPARLEELWTKANSWQQLAQEEKAAKASYDKSFSVLKQFYEGDDGGSTSSGSGSTG